MRHGRCWTWVSVKLHRTCSCLGSTQRPTIWPFKPEPPRQIPTDPTIPTQNHLSKKEANAGRVPLGPGTAPRLLSSASCCGTSCARWPASHDTRILFKSADPPVVGGWVWGWTRGGGGSRMEAWVWFRFGMGFRMGFGRSAENFWECPYMAPQGGPVLGGWVGTLPGGLKRSLYGTSRKRSGGWCRAGRSCASRCGRGSAARRCGSQG